MERSAHRILTILSVMLAVFALAAPGQADTLKVPSDAFPTIQAAVDAAAAGDTVAIGSGAYEENVVVPPGKDGLVIKGQGKVYVDAMNNDEGPNSDGILIQSDDVTVSKLTVRHAQGDGIAAYAASEGLPGPTGVRVEKVVVINSEGSGIDIEGNDALVAGCRLTGCGDGVYIDGDGAEVSKTTVTNDDDNGVEVNGDDGTITSNQIGVVSDYGIEVSGDRVLVANNSVAATDDTGIYTTGDDTTVEKNRIQGTMGTAVEVSGINPTVVGNRVDGTADEGDGIDVSANDEVPGGRVESNRIANVMEDGLIISGGGVTVLKNRVEMSGSEDDAGIEINGDDHMVEGNTVSDCDSTGIEVSGSGHMLLKNKVSDNTDNGIFVDGLDIELDGNSISGNAGEGLENEGLSTTFRNNTFKGNRIDVTNDTDGGAVLTDGGGNKFVTGGTMVQPEVD